MSSFDYEAFLNLASSRPGVYRMYDAESTLLYVGKAKNLKKRLTSYFRKTGLESKTIALVNRIDHIETTITTTETEALLLEQTLIKEHKPPYNISLRDDKSYAYIYLSSDQEYPRLAFHRGARKKKGRYFGPYPSAASTRETLALLQKMFRVRQCEDSYFSNRSRPCLQYQIKRCTAPCTKLITPEEYAEDVRHSEMFLEGGSDSISDELGLKMEACAENMEFEKAARYRDQIRDLRLVQERQFVSSEKGDVDVIALQQDAGLVCLHVVCVRGGRILGNRNFYPRFTLESSAGEVMRAFVGQFYLQEYQRKNIPAEVIVSHMPDESAMMAEGLAVYAGHAVTFKDSVRSHRAQWLNMAVTNAEHGLMSKLNSRQSMEQRFAALQQALSLDTLPGRLECFDISHSSGEATVASCVVFDSNGPLKSDYRRFNIEDITPGDDYAAMEQALIRRYRRLVNGEGRLPDLLLIDGGKGQLTQAEEVLAKLGVTEVMLLGIAKGISRKAGQETLFFGGSRDELVLPPESPALHLLQHIRDEAHRFAITAHRQRRGKKRTQSALEDIPGVGPRKRRDLIRFFGGPHEIKKASVEELMRVQGISKKLAREIHDFLKD